jgi:hypothetical protein
MLDQHARRTIDVRPHDRAVAIRARGNARINDRTLAIGSDDGRRLRRLRESYGGQAWHAS